MTAQQVLHTLEQLAQRHLKFAGPLQLDTSLNGELAPDSLARLTLLVEVENAFRTCIEDDDAQQLHTVGDLVALLVRQGGTDEAAPT